MGNCQSQKCGRQAIFLAIFCLNLHQIEKKMDRLEDARLLYHPHPPPPIYQMHYLPLGRRAHTVLPLLCSPPDVASRGRNNPTRLASVPCRDAEGSSKQIGSGGSRIFLRGTPTPKVGVLTYYRSGTVNSKSFVGKVLLRIK